MAKWLGDNLVALAVFGALAILASFLRVRVVPPVRKLLATGFVLLGLVVWGVYHSIHAPPGGGEIVPEPAPVDPRPIAPDSAIRRLQQPWDSEASADWAVAETLADISESAYLPPVDADRVFRSLGFSQVMPIVQGSMIGYVISGGNVTVVAFRGTDFAEVSDWLANVDTAQMETEHGHVHKGFFSAYESMKPQVEEILKERAHEHLWITGHSLGGALALSCAYDFHTQESRAFDGLITFGQPMVARAELATFIDRELSGRYARFVNRHDVVPRVPPNFAACGSLVWFTDDGLKRSKRRTPIYGAPVGAAPEAVADEESEVTPMSDREFERLQQRLKRENAQVERLPEGSRSTRMAYGDGASSAGSSLVEDHSMWSYLEKVRSMLGITP